MNWDIVIGICTIITAMAAIIALYFTSQSTERTANTLEYQILKQTFDDIQESEKELNQLNRENKTISRGVIAAWDSLYFNKLELFSFMVNLGHVNMTHAKFFKEIIITAYENNYLKYHKKDVAKKNSYPEFKALYNKFKDL